MQHHQHVRQRPCSTQAPPGLIYLPPYPLATSSFLCCYPSSRLNTYLAVVRLPVAKEEDEEDEGRRSQTRGGDRTHLPQPASIGHGESGGAAGGLRGAAGRRCRGPAQAAADGAPPAAMLSIRALTVLLLPLPDNASPCRRGRLADPTARRRTAASPTSPGCALSAGSCCSGTCRPATPRAPPSCSSSGQFDAKVALVGACSRGIVITVFVLLITIMITSLSSSSLSSSSSSLSTSSSLSSLSP